MELRKLSSRADYDAAAARLFGDRPREANEQTQPYKADQYRKQLGIDIYKYAGFFVEIGHADAPIGPVIPATDRIPIKPILAIRQSRRGNYYVEGLELADGLFNKDKTTAWVKTEQFDVLLGDDYFAKIEERLEDVMQKTESEKPVHLVELSGLSDNEREVFEKLHAGVDFADLSSSERSVLGRAMERITKGTDDVS